MKKLIFLFFAIAHSAIAAEVALDSGHSRRNPGAMSALGIPEWELNRQLALDVAQHLERLGIRYRLIGSDGNMEVLTDRTDLAQSDQLFISLHHDAVLPEWLAHVERYRGYSLFISRQNPKINASLNCARHLGDRLLAAGFKPSGYHATPVKGENRPFADRRRGIHYFDELAVLRTARQPAVLVEAGVIVNRTDEIRVTSEKGREKLADAIASGINDCLARSRKK